MDLKGNNFGRALNPQSFTVIDLVLKELQSEGLERNLLREYG